MSLPEPYLDNLRFQRDLVDEARRRIVRYCPEWTEYNVSDPGVTLIELFAWMTEMIVYRLNRVPEKNYVHFLELAGVSLQPASSARADLTFWLSAPLPFAEGDDTMVVVPRGTEVATRRTEDEPEIVFTTDERLNVVPPVLTQLRRDADFNRNYLSRLGVEDFSVFSPTPQEGDTFYLGFDEGNDVRGHLLQLRFECQRSEATGIKREDPPLVWECSMGDGEWQEVALSSRTEERDTTGGLNNPDGQLVLYLPMDMKPGQVHGRQAYWVRCRFEVRRPEQGRYTESPRIQNVVAHALGATTGATHALIVEDEVLGRSSGEPGQIFRLANAPVLSLREGETVEVEEERDGMLVFVPWEPVEDFASSSRYDRHVTLDTTTGEVCFGPGIRQPDGTVRQYGRIPEAGRQIRFSRYRYGGGVMGNVPAGKLQVLKSAIAYVDEVTNLHRAVGGRDQESLEEAKMRARREMRAQQRAATAEDFESLGLRASRSVARIKCLRPDEVDQTLPPGTVDLLVVPAAFDALRVGDLSRLHVDEELKSVVAAHLDQYRLLTTTLRIDEPRYVGIKVTAEIVPTEHVAPEVVTTRVTRALQGFLTPLAWASDGQLPSGFLDPDWEGWPFGRDLHVVELYNLIQQVPGVKHVWDVQLSRRELIPGAEAGQEEADLTPVEGRLLRVPADTLLCSLDHEVQVVEE